MDCQIMMRLWQNLSFDKISNENLDDGSTGSPQEMRSNTSL